jgi:ABC-2 type transport system ATP-binding protein
MPAQHASETQSVIAAPPMIELREAAKRFGATQALAGLSLTVARGEIFGLVGPDGAGKSTTMRILASILPPDAGAARVAGLDCVRDADAVKDRIAYMSQTFGLYQDLTVAENIDFYADLYGVPRQGRQQRVDELLDFSTMRQFKRRLAGRLSGGMKQKLQLVCALIHTPEVLLLDEPTNGVDPVSRRDFWRILYQLVQDGVTIFVSTAYLDEAERCNRLALLHEGRLLGLGTPAEVKALLPGAILEVRTPQARQLIQRLRSELAGLSAGLFGDRVHLVTRTLAETEREVRRVAQGAGIALAEAREVAPTLEDVFVAVIGEQGAERAEAAHA